MSDWEVEEDEAPELPPDVRLRIWCLTYLTEAGIAGESPAEAVSGACVIEEYLTGAKARKH